MCEYSVSRLRGVFAAERREAMILFGSAHVPWLVVLSTTLSFW